jgi:putative methyltransferase (TIGR04325 family)
MRISDYPVLFWMRDIAANEPLRVFDFGGGIGQTFVNYSATMPEEVLSEWIVQDLPEVVRRASIAVPCPPSKLHFTSRLDEGVGCNVVLAAGALHYWENSLASLFDELRTKPAHFIINRSPMTTRSTSFCTVQQGHNWAVACKVRNFDEVTEEMLALGYKLIDTWKDPQKNLIFPWLPAYSCAYYGAYFRRIERTT